MKPLAKTIAHTLAALGLASAAISPVFAAQAAPMAIEIKTSDLDLATAKGQKTLEQRVEKAARQVCRSAIVTSGTRVMSQDARACLAKARSEARQQAATLASDEQRGG